MGGEQDEAERPTLAQRFLRQHRPAVFGSARSDSGDNDQGIGVDNETEEPREADGWLDVNAPEISGGHNVEGNGEDGVPAPEVLPPKHLFLAPRPRAKGVNHPPVPTRAQIDRHALEQHVNYAPWRPHFVQASALMKQHPLVTGRFAEHAHSERRFMLHEKSRRRSWRRYSGPRHEGKSNQVTVQPRVRWEKHVQGRVLIIPYWEMH